MTTETATGASAPNSNLIHFQENELVNTTSEGKPVTTSLRIAGNLEKEHKNILRSIRKLECSYEFGKLNFQMTSYINDRGKEYPMYLITRNGFDLLTLGFTGKKMMEWKEKYIAAFNAMEKKPSDMHISILPAILAKIDRLEVKMDQFRINANVYDPMWSFAHKYCDVGMGHVAAKDDLYSIYLEHCQKRKVHAECKAHFFTKLYRAVETTYSSTLMIHGSSVRVVRCLGLKQNYKELLAKAGA